MHIRILFLSNYLASRLTRVIKIGTPRFGRFHLKIDRPQLAHLEIPVIPREPCFSTRQRTIHRRTTTLRCLQTADIPCILNPQV